MSFIRSLLPLKPTSKGLAFVKTETFLRTLQLVAKKMLSQGHNWEEIDVQLRDITVRELLPKRSHSADEVCDFYRNYFQIIDSTWLFAVQTMKESWTVMEQDPKKFLRDLGLLPGKPAGVAPASALDRKIEGKSTMNAPKEWKENVDYV